MILDKFLQVSNAQVLTATAASTDVIDMGVANRDAGAGEPLYMVFSVDVTLDSSGEAATLTLAIQDSADNSSWATVSATDAIAEASLAAGYTRALPLPPGMRRYVRAYYTVGTENFTTGSISAQIVHDIQRNIAYPDAL